MVTWPMKSNVEDREDDILVRCRAKAKDSDYEGPAVRVWGDKTWVYVSTDDYDGTAMFNLEALPAVRHALGMLARKLSQQKS